MARVFHQRVRGFDERIHAAHVQIGVAQRARHLVVDFHDQVAGACATVTGYPRWAELM